ncbi:glycosyltransferase family 4 protein [bacterium]|nr:glycosyltransferase family 4 protein [bacterium]
MNRSEKRIVMLLSNGFEPDVRVFKEGSSLVRHGYQVDLICWDRERDHPSEATCNGIRIHRFQWRGTYGKALLCVPGYVAFYIHAIRRLLRMKPAAIHCHDLDTLIPGFIAGRFTGAGIVYDAHEIEYFIHFPRWLRRGFSRVEKMLAKRCNAVFVVNSPGIDKFSRMGLASDRLVLLRNGPFLNLSASAFPLACRGVSERIQTSSSLQIEDSPPLAAGRFNGFGCRINPRRAVVPVVLGMIGYIQSGMGIERILELFDELCAKTRDIRLLLVGKIEPRYETVLHSRIRRLKNPDKVIRVGRIPYPEVLKYYTQMDIAIMLHDTGNPQYRYSTPTKLYEAMVFSLPVLASPIGDVGEILRQAGCGIAVQPSDRKQLLSVLSEWVANRPLRRRLGINGRSYALRHFTWEMIEARLCDAYSRLPHARSHTPGE